jgi:hypothetical protein
LSTSTEVSISRLLKTSSPNVALNGSTLHAHILPLDGAERIVVVSAQHFARRHRHVLSDEEFCLAIVQRQDGGGRNQV